MANVITDPFQRFFRRKEAEQNAEEAAAVQVAVECLAWSAMPYHQRFMADLDREIARPIDVNLTDRAVLQTAVRQNTIREIRESLTARVKRAELVIANSRE